MTSLSLFKPALGIAMCAAIAIAMPACSDDDNVTPSHSSTSSSDSSSSTTEISSTTIEANRFVHDVMSDYYYWNTEMPSLNYRTQSNTSEYFYNLLSSKDRFSYISDDATSTLSEFAGEYTDFGWEYQLSYFSSTSDSVVAIITYVYDNTPASQAGALRGDVVHTVDGTAITIDNYRSIFTSASSGTFKAYRVEDGKLTDVAYTMTAASITENPVAVSKVIEQSDGTKVGYLFYTSYSATFNDDLVAAITSFKESGVSDVVLDLRYNPGGDSQALQYMGSMLAPASAVSSKSEMIYYEFNSLLQKYSGYDRESTALNFTDAPGVNLDLSRLVVLVSGSTYSASEATIWSLMPYMDVTLIGDTTGGKNTMMYVMSPEDFTYSSTGLPYYSTSINNWLIMPIVAVYKNSTGKAFDTSNGYGLAPNYYVRDLSALLSKGVKQIGDPEENLLAAALDYLANGTVSTNKSLSTEPQPARVASSVDKKPQVLYQRAKIQK